MEAHKVLTFLSVFILFRRIWAVDITDTRHIPQDRECYGTNMGFSFSGSQDFHYSSLRRRYSGCWHVNGNLEITHLLNNDIDYDLSFLSEIRVVTGYVLLGLLNVRTIPLTNLKLIRADNTMSLMGGQYSLVVVLTSGAMSGVEELQLPSLREISQGNVLFSGNPFLCYVNTIAWDVIVLNSKFPVEIHKDGVSSTCGSCPAQCTDSDGQPRCWGPSRHLCQEVKRVNCDSLCPGRCHKSGILGCCHPECAIGCRGGLDTECEMCKYFRYGHKCVPECPKNTYPLAADCIPF